MDDFGHKLIDWYRKNMRDLPWRETTDAYHIWLSEVILQQTRVEQGLGYYQRFIKKFPDVFALANASTDAVFKMWQGLGYYSRAGNLLAAARTIANEYGGRFPVERQELMKIKGIGPYTSAAIVSMAYGRNEAVVDGNVYRVLSRLFGIETAIDSNQAKHEFGKLAIELMADHPPGEFNQALMEFGALHCKPRNPDCLNCIFRNECHAYENNLVYNYPVKKARPKRRNRYFYYLVVESSKKGDRHFVLNRRIKRDIWKNLYDFPLIEKHVAMEPLEVLKEDSLGSLLSEANSKVVNISTKYSHQLTHQRIHAWFIRVIVDKKINFPDEFSLLLVKQNEINHYPVPRLIEKYLKEQDLI